MTAKKNEVTVHFTVKEYEKIKGLADRRNQTVSEVIRSFANTIVEGDSWKHPSGEKKEG